MATYILMNISNLTLALLADVSYSGKQCIMDHCLPPFLFHKQAQDAALIYSFLECMPARESTADCMVQQFSRILQSHFISFSSLNPMTLTQLTFLIEKADFWILQVNIVGKEGQTILLELFISNSASTYLGEEGQHCCPKYVFVFSAVNWE